MVCHAKKQKKSPGRAKDAEKAQNSKEFGENGTSDNGGKRPWEGGGQAFLTGNGRGNAPGIGYHLGRRAKRERVMAMASARGMGLHSWPGPQVSE